MAKYLCIYHANCDDGFAAAWVVFHAFLEGGCDFYAAEYQKPPPDVTDRRVIIVDFSYPRNIILEMAALADSILVLDHHKTAQAELENHKFPNNVEIHFDMKRCGAMMAWNHFNPELLVPRFLDYIQDRDLWTKQLPFIEEFSMAVRSYPKDFNAWDIIAEKSPEDLIKEGGAILRYNRILIEQHKVLAYKFKLAGHVCMMVNAPYIISSEVAGELARENPDVAFGVSWMEETPGRYRYSLRSRNDFDVSAVAKNFGGGGHAAAAGFYFGAPPRTLEASAQLR